MLMQSCKSLAWSFPYHADFGEVRKRIWKKNDPGGARVSVKTWQSERLNLICASRKHFSFQNRSQLRRMVAKFEFRMRSSKARMRKLAKRLNWSLERRLTNIRLNSCWWLHFSGDLLSNEPTGMGGWHSKEVAFALHTQPARVQLSAFPRFFPFRNFLMLLWFNDSALLR